MNKLAINLFTKIFGELVGTDKNNNKYYRGKFSAINRRWVIYASEANQFNGIDQEWYNWLYRAKEGLSSPSCSRKIPISQDKKHYQCWSLAKK